MYRYQFVSTVADLLEAESAERARFMRAPFQWSMILLGVAWLVVAVMALSTVVRVQYLLWLAIALAIVSYFAVRPYLARARIRRSNAMEQRVNIEFTDSGVRVAVEGIGDFSRAWSELIEIVDTDRGVLFYFEDGVKNWIPGRELGSPVERAQFVEFVDRQMSRAVARD